jgi:tetratricopeptide (TPR) repeat protein
MMKKILTLFLAIFFAATLHGQATVDYILKAKALIDNGKAVQANGLLTGAISENNDSRLFVLRGEAKILTGDFTGAISDFNAANGIIPGSGEYGLAKVYSLKGDAATSVYHLERNLGSSLRKQEKEILLDPAFGKVENSAEWRQLWKKEWYSKSEKVLSEIEYYTAAGKIDESKVLLNEIKSGFPDSDDAGYAEALINLASGKYSDAAAVADRLTASHPESEKYLRLLAKSQVMSSNPSGALLTYTRLLDLGVADAQLFMLRAECYRKTGETEKAQADVKKFLDLYPADKSALSMAGRLESALGDNLKAIEFFSGNIKLHPG